MEVLSLSQETAKILSASVDHLSADILAKLCRNFLQRLLLGVSNIAIEEKYQGAVEAIGTLLLDAAKTRSTELQLK